MPRPICDACCIGKIIAIGLTPMLWAICGISSTNARKGALPEPIIIAAANVTIANTNAMANGGRPTDSAITIRLSIAPLTLIP